MHLKLGRLAQCVPPALCLFVGACSFVVDGDRFRPDGSTGGRDAGDRIRDGGRGDAGVVDSGTRDAGDAGDVERDGGPDGGGRDVGPRDGGRDGGPRDGGPRDGGPDAGQIDSGVVALAVDPPSLLEGLGSEVPVPLVLADEDLPAHPVLEQSGSVTLTFGAVVAGDGILAVPVGVPVDPNHDEADGDREVIIVVRDGDGGPFYGEARVTIAALDELALASPGSPNAADLNGRYSEVVIAAGAQQDVSGVASVPLSITATGRMIVAGTIVVDAAPGAQTAGGCAGGGSSTHGGCDANGGRAGPGGTGGGGGGNALAGGAGGSGGNGGAGGVATSGAWVTPLLAARGNGGGGGGNNLTVAGARGGAGGGVVALTSLGTLQIQGATISVRGEDGVDSNACLALNGAGGGGSGGSVLVRGRALVGTNAFTFDVRAGAGGTGGEGSCPARNGGDGSRGRSRIDLPLTVVPLDVMPSRDSSYDRVGPSFAANHPIIQGSTVQLDFYGTDGTAYPVSVDGTNTVNVMPTLGTATQQFGNVSAGLHTFCVAVPGGLGIEEGQTCIDIAVVP